MWSLNYLLFGNVRSFGTEVVEKLWYSLAFCIVVVSSLLFHPLRTKHIVLFKYKEVLSLS